jgi:hypothetical protein
MSSWRFRRRGRLSGAQRTVQILSKAVFDMARIGRGALIVLPGRDVIEHYTEGGQVLEGHLSHPLLMSLFDANSPGHDGAIILAGDRVHRFAVHLPLSRNFEEIREGGTRHSAALGLSECTDAMAVLVSEERREVSVARDGRLRNVDGPEALQALILEHTGARSPVPTGGSGLGVFPRRVLEVFGAVALALGLWWLSIAGTSVVERTLAVPVRVENIGPANEVASVTPPTVDVTFQGLGRDLYLMDPTSLEVRLDASMAEAGTRIFFVSSANVTELENVDVVGIRPHAVVLEVKERDTESRAEPGGSSDLK